MVTAARRFRMPLSSHEREDYEFGREGGPYHMYNRS